MITVSRRGILQLSRDGLILTLRRRTMRSKIDVALRPMTILCCVLCGVGAVASVFVILVRVPSVASTKIEVLLGTL
jgi:hypothetical protein